MVAAAVVVGLSAAAVAGARPGEDQITYWFTGTAFQTRDYWATTVSKGHHLVDRETTTITFRGSCEELIAASRVRPGEPLLCNAKDSMTVLGRIDYEDLDHPSQSCVGTIRFRPGADAYLGGTLEAPGVINSYTGAPFAATQLAVTNANPLESGCSGLALESPGSPDTFTVDGHLGYPNGRAEHSWSRALGTADAPVHVLFSATLSVTAWNYSSNYDQLVDAVLRQLAEWWNAAQAAGRSSATSVPSTITIEIPAVGTFHGTWTPAGSSRGPLRGAHTAAGALFSVDQRTDPGLNVLHVRLTPLGRAVLAGSASAPAVRGTLTFTPAQGSPVTLTETFTPHVAPAIASVQFTGTPANPTLIVRGRGLAPLPAESPSGSPVGHNGCPAQSGNYGFDYGTQLYVNDLSKGWAAGLSYANNTACVGLIPTKATWNELDLRLGSFYTGLYPKFALAAGDEVQVVANGAPIDVHVNYGAPVTK